MFEMLSAVFSAGRLSYLKFYSTLYWRILYSIGGTGHCTPNGYTSMSTASTTSTWLHLYIWSSCLYTMHASFLNRSSCRSSMMIDTHSNNANPWCRYATPFGLTSEYAHPAEILFLGFATVVGPALTGPHLLTLWLWVVLRVLETVEAHSGYHFPWSPSNFLPLYGG